MGTVDRERYPDFPAKLSLWQRLALRRLRRRAGRGSREPLSAEDWPVVWALDHTFGARAVHRLWRTLPGSVRCTMCSAPFTGPGRFLPKALGYRPSRKNPHYCATCVELSPPGGTTMVTGVLFADLRGFTRTSEDADPEQVSKTLRRFYGCAEEVLFPHALIDKLMGDEVMALYLDPLLQKDEIPGRMIEHAQALMKAVGYGSGEAPFVELGIGLDYGQAFVGNIGDRSVFDFTAVGDVVNTASRLQGQAGSGEIYASSRVVAGLAEGFGEPIELKLKGKSHPEVAYRAVAGR